MHVNGELGFSILKKIFKNFPKVKSGIFCGDICIDKESFNNYKTNNSKLQKLNNYLCN